MKIFLVNKPSAKSLVEQEHIKYLSILGELEYSVTHAGLGVYKMPTFNFIFGARESAKKMIFLTFIASCRM